MRNPKAVDSRKARGAGTSGEPGSRRKYAPPTLRVYGSVAQLTMTGSGSTTDGGKSMKTSSDRRLKEAIVRVGEHPLGFGIYLFRYRNEFSGEHGSGTRLGVMADEVAAVMPAAVVVGADGYQRVDYAMLGVHPAVR